MPGLTFEEVRARGTAMVEALNARDFAAIAAMPAFDNDSSEFNSAVSAADGDIYRGIDGLRRWARDVDATWDDFRFELLRVEPAGEGRAVAEFRATGTARVSGVPLDTRTGQIWHWSDDGVMIRNDSFTDPREAFEVAGVPYG